MEKREQEIDALVTAFEVNLPPRLAVHLSECEACWARVMVLFLAKIEESAEMTRVFDSVFGSRPGCRPS